MNFSNNKLYKKIKIFWAKPFLFGNEQNVAKKAIHSTWISGGPYINKFEDVIKKKFNTKFAFAVSNGTAALHAAFLAANLKPNDVILIPAYGYMAAANIAKLMHLKVEFADVCKKTFCITLDNIKKNFNNKIKAIVLINTYGNCVEITEINKFANKKGIIVIEDAAESFGSKIDNKYSGTQSTIGTFSFHATKNITTGEGGMIITSNKIIADKIKLYRNHGVFMQNYKHLLHGHNFRMTNIQAAIGYEQFKFFNIIMKRRKKIFNLYLKYLDLKDIKLQHINDNVDFIPWTIALNMENKKIDIKTLIKKMLVKGIETRNGFYSSDRLKIFNSKKFNNSNILSNNIICLPFHLHLNQKKIKYICENFNYIVS